MMGWLHSLWFRFLHQVGAEEDWLITNRKCMRKLTNWNFNLTVFCWKVYLNKLRIIFFFFYFFMIFVFVWSWFMILGRRRNSNYFFLCPYELKFFVWQLYYIFLLSLLKYLRNKKLGKNIFCQLEVNVGNSKVFVEVVYS